jgi:chloramphenicol 3-O-phosphotransferase
MRLLIVPIGKLAQICNVVVRTQSSEIRDVFGRWLTAACAAGVRFVVLEGLMRSGKSCLTEQPFALGMSQSVNIELDGFLRKPAAGTALHRRFTDAR